MIREELLIEVEELQRTIDDPNLRLFDSTVLLTPQKSESGLSRYNDGHLPGAAFLDHAAISRKQASPMFMLPPETELAAAIGRLGISNNNNVVVYSTDSIMWATRLWWILKYLGHKNIRVLNGGRDAWTGALVKTPNRFEATTFVSNLSHGMIADKEEVLAAINDGATCMLNSLPHSFYTGEADIPYAREGHITGSLSMSFEKMMDGHFLKPTETLAEEFSKYETSDRIITYCGGGIAATLTASCARLVGFDDVAVYDGSLSEWLEAGLPTTTGAEPGHLS